MMNPISSCSIPFKIRLFYHESDSESQNALYYYFQRIAVLAAQPVEKEVVMALVQGLQEQTADAGKKVHYAGAYRVAVCLHVKVKSLERGHEPFVWAQNP